MDLRADPRAGTPGLRGCVRRFSEGPGRRVVVVGSTGLESGPSGVDEVVPGPVAWEPESSSSSGTHDQAGRPGAAGAGDSLQSFLETTAVVRHVIGSPGLGLLRRLRPVPSRSADGGPNPCGHVGDAAKRADQGRFPCSLVDRSTEEAPDSTPATSPWLPRSTSPRPPHRFADSPGSSPPP
jgi:hypothetical protein